MSTVNLYDILNLSQDCTQDDIKKAHKKLAKKYHPDKKGGDTEMYQLITDAYNILSTTKSRADYDEIYALSKQAESDHYQLKTQALDYLKAQKTETNVAKSKKELEKDFKKSFEEMDRKHQYKRDNDGKTISGKEVDKMLKDLELVRQQEDIENIHEKLFDHDRINIKKFNAAFDAMYKKHNELIPHTGNPDPWNSAQGVDSSYSNINSYEDLYVENDDTFSTAYTSLKLEADKSTNKVLDKESVAKLSGAEYTDRHNFIEDDYNKIIEEKLKERNASTKKLDDRSVAEFDTDPTCGGYGIFSNIKNINSLSWDDNEDIKTKYNKLLEMRNKKLDE